MPKLEPPVLTDPDTRKRYDDLWALWPYENRSAYWLRAGPHGMVCTRCGGTVPGTCEVAEFEDFTAKHLACPLGVGLDGPGSRAQDAVDPLFDEGEGT